MVRVCATSSRLATLLNCVKVCVWCPFSTTPASVVFLSSRQPFPQLLSFNSVSLSTFPSFVLPPPLPLFSSVFFSFPSFLHALSLLSLPSPTLPHFILLPSSPPCSQPSLRPSFLSYPPFHSLSSSLPTTNPILRLKFGHCCECNEKGCCERGGRGSEKKAGTE